MAICGRPFGPMTDHGCAPQNAARRARPAPEVCQPRGRRSVKRLTVVAPRAMIDRSADSLWKTLETSPRSAPPALAVEALWRRPHGKDCDPAWGGGDATHLLAAVLSLSETGGGARCQELAPTRRSSSGSPCPRRLALMPRRF